MARARTKVYSCAPWLYQTERRTHKVSSPRTNCESTRGCEAEAYLTRHTELGMSDSICGVSACLLLCLYLTFGFSYCITLLLLSPSIQAGAWGPSILIFKITYKTLTKNLCTPRPAMKHMPAPNRIPQIFEVLSLVHSNLLSTYVNSPSYQPERHETPYVAARRMFMVSLPAKIRNLMIPFSSRRS